MRTLRELVWARCVASTLPEIVSLFPSCEIVPDSHHLIGRQRAAYELAALVAGELADAAVREFERRFPFEPRPQRRVHMPEEAPTSPALDAVPLIGGAPLEQCPATAHRGTYLFRCTLAIGHGGRHRSVHGTTGKLQAQWTTEQTLGDSEPVPASEVAVIDDARKEGIR